MRNTKRDWQKILSRIGRKGKGEVEKLPAEDWRMVLEWVYSISFQSLQAIARVSRLWEHLAKSIRPMCKKSWSVYSCIQPKYGIDHYDVFRADLDDQYEYMIPIKEITKKDLLSLGETDLNFIGSKRIPACKHQFKNLIRNVLGTISEFDETVFKNFYKFCIQQQHKRPISDDFIRRCKKKWDKLLKEERQRDEIRKKSAENDYYWQSIVRDS